MVDSLFENLVIREIIETEVHSSKNLLHDIGAKAMGLKLIV
jgi:hypothetical protein